MSETVKNYVYSVKAAHYIIDLWRKEILRLKEDYKTICKTEKNYKTIIDESVRESFKDCKKIITKLIDEDQNRIRTQQKRLKEFTKHIEKLKISVTKQYLIDYVINNMSDNDICAKYCYSDITTVYKVKRNAIKKLETVIILSEKECCAGATNPPSISAS